MPHTSHRKKPQRNKRIAVADQDGWTRVTSYLKTDTGDSGKGLPTSSSLPKEPYANHDGSTHAETHPNKQMTVEEIEQQYKAIEEKWLATDSWIGLKEVLQKRALRGGTKISNCILFGSGTPTGFRRGWIHRHEVALYQIAAFKTAVDVVEQITGSRPPSYAQEPIYQELDIQLLALLGITCVDDPDGFELLTEDSFAYTPGAELNVEMRALFRNPNLMLTTKIDSFWRNAEGVALTDRYSEETSQTASGNPSDTAFLADTENNCQVQETFKAEHDSARLPDLEAKDYPFYQMHLYWRSSPEKTEGAS